MPEMTREEFLAAVEGHLVKRHNVDADQAKEMVKVENDRFVLYQGRGAPVSVMVEATKQSAYNGIEASTEMVYAVSQELVARLVAERREDLRDNPTREDEIDCMMEFMWECWTCRYWPGKHGHRLGGEQRVCTSEDGPFRGQKTFSSGRCEKWDAWNMDVWEEACERSMARMPQSERGPKR